MSSKREKLNDYQLVIFDWDGTIADSLQHIVKSIRFAIDKLGFPAKAEDEIRNIIGLGLDEALERLFPRISSIERQIMAGHYREYYLSTTADNIALFPQAEQTIKLLHSNGYNLAVATGKSRRGLNRALEESKLSGYFHYTRCADETFSKPNPQMINDILGNFSIAADKALMIGDSEHDLQMANNAGIASAAVSYGAQNKEYLLKFKPLTCFNSLKELPLWLEQCLPSIKD